MKKIYAILIIFPLAGGCDNRKNDLESCRLEAVRAYPNAPTSQLSDYTNFVNKCMEAKGYVLNTPGK